MQVEGEHVGNRIGWGDTARRWFNTRNFARHVAPSPVYDFAVKNLDWHLLLLLANVLRQFVNVLVVQREDIRGFVEFHLRSHAG